MIGKPAVFLSIGWVYVQKWKHKQANIILRFIKMGGGCNGIHGNNEMLQVKDNEMLFCIMSKL